MPPLLRSGAQSDNGSDPNFWGLESDENEMSSFEGQAWAQAERIPIAPRPASRRWICQFDEYRTDVYVGKDHVLKSNDSSCQTIVIGQITD